MPETITNMKPEDTIQGRKLTMDEAMQKLRQHMEEGTAVMKGLIDENELLKEQIRVADVAFNHLHKEHTDLQKVSFEMAGLLCGDTPMTSENKQKVLTEFDRIMKL